MARADCNLLQHDIDWISLRVDDPTVPQIRLDSGWYYRMVTVDEV
jgi:hypothetical protein